jgi:FAD/FMN-containing dehydrogenase
MASLPAWLTEIKQFLDKGEIIEPDSPLCSEQTSTWAAQKNLKPQMLVRPQSAKSLSHLLQYLNTTTIDFGIRSGGIGSSSASGVLISLSAFNSFFFDPQNETISIGTGQTWGEVDRKLEEQAPGQIGTS